jgi:hypothetical protein
VANLRIMLHREETEDGKDRYEQKEITADATS